MNNTTNTTAVKRTVDVRRLVFTALMAALAIILSELLKFKVPIMPGFISFDFSDVPALLASLTMGPLSGVAVCLIKNLEGLFSTATGGVGELSNFILSACLVLPAGIIAKRTHKYPHIIMACLGGAVFMALMSIVSNLFVVYPIYISTGLAEEAIIGMYKAILPSVNTLTECIVIFNAPFTLVKGLCAAVISIPLFKRLRPIFNSIYREK